MIDIILYAPTGKSTIAAFAKAHPPANPMLQEDADGNDIIRPGISWCWWGGTGNFMTAPAVVDENGDVTTPATYAPGAVAMLRVSADFFGDRLEPAEGDPDAAEQWARSKVAQYIKNNGTFGSMVGGTIPYYELDGVRLLRPSDVEAFMSANNCTRHEWLGGNSY